MNANVSSRRLFAAPAFAVAGAAAIGWILAMPHGAPAQLRTAVAAPALALGLVSTLTPALYIALTLTGAETGPRRFAGAALAGLRAGGLAGLALAAPLLFLAATSTEERTPELLGGLAMAAAAAAGLVVLGRRAAERYQLESKLCLLAWSIAAIAIGGRLLHIAVAWGAR